MKLKHLILSVLLSCTTIAAIAQNDTLVFYVKANGDRVPDRQSANFRLIVFPVGSGSNPKLSAIKGLGMRGELRFSASSSVHGFPVKIVGVFIEYYPDGSKMSVKNFDDGVMTGESTVYYPNGKIRSVVRPRGRDGYEREEYYEDGTLSFEHRITGRYNYHETSYYPNGKTRQKLTIGDRDGNALIGYYENGIIKSTELADANGKITKITYFHNGNLYYKKEGGFNRNRAAIRYIECRDSTGKPLVQKGNGYWVEFDESFSFKSSQGKVKNGWADSVWTMLDMPKLGAYKTYEDGKLIHTEPFQIKDTSGAPGDRAPEFRGGIEELYKFLSKNIKYPATARENGADGDVVLSFIVGLDGTLSDIKVVRGIGFGCDDEAVRAMKESPPWIPATGNGVPVSVRYSLPIRFILENNGTLTRILVGYDN